jgi:hypothetical protein
MGKKFVCISCGEIYSPIKHSKIKNLCNSCKQQRRKDLLYNYSYEYRNGKPKSKELDTRIALRNRNWKRKKELGVITIFLGKLVRSCLDIYSMVVMYKVDKSLFINRDLLIELNRLHIRNKRKLLELRKKYLLSVESGHERH